MDLQLITDQNIAEIYKNTKLKRKWSSKKVSIMLALVRESWPELVIKVMKQLKLSWKRWKLSGVQWENVREVTKVLKKRQKTRLRKLKNGVLKNLIFRNFSNGDPLRLSSPLSLKTIWKCILDVHLENQLKNW